MEAFHAGTPLDQTGPAYDLEGIIAMLSTGSRLQGLLRSAVRFS
jgi:hypothetical protein